MNCGLYNIYVGQKLYFIDKNSELLGEIEVVYVDDDGFGFYLDNKPRKLSYAVIDSRLYLAPGKAWDAWWSTQNRRKAAKSVSQRATHRKETAKPTPQQTAKAFGVNRNGRRTPLPPTQAPLPPVRAIENSLPEPRTMNLRSADDAASPASRPAPPHSCDTCQLRRNETCTLIRSELCGDYKAVPWVSTEERSTWADKSMIELFRERDYNDKYKRRR